MRYRQQIYKQVSNIGDCISFSTTALDVTITPRHGVSAWAIFCKWWVNAREWWGLPYPDLQRGGIELCTRSYGSYSYAWAHLNQMHLRLSLQIQTPSIWNQHRCTMLQQDCTVSQLEGGPSSDQTTTWLYRRNCTQEMHTSTYNNKVSMMQRLHVRLCIHAWLWGI